MSKFITLTRGQVTEVADEDFDWLIQYKWHTNFCKNYADGGKFVALRQDKGKTVRMHRAIMEKIVGRRLDKLEFVDHIDRNPLNNCRDNLRIVNASQNRMNSLTPSNNSSGYRGVSFSKRHKKWKAEITVGKERLFLGYFDTPALAGKAYEIVAVEHFGEYRPKVSTDVMKVNDGKRFG